MKQIIHIVLLASLACGEAAAQTFAEFITINNGLSQNYTFDILQDFRGFLWMGTKEGINRYDGYSVVTYRNDPFDTATISSNTVTTLFEDKELTLWIGTSSGGLNKFDRNTETFRRRMHAENDPLSLSNNHILCITEGDSGALWIGTQNGLNRYDKKEGTVRRYFSDASDPLSLASSNIIDVLAERETVWISTTRGLSYLVLRTGAAGRIVDSRFPEIQARGTTALYRDSKNRLLVGARSGLFVHTSTGFVPLLAANDSNGFYWISRIREDQDRNLWISSGNTLAMIAPSGRISTVETLKHERFSRGLWIDRSKVVWAGTSGLGALMFRPRREQFGKREGNFLAELFAREIHTINGYFAQRGIPYFLDMNFRGANFFSAAEEGKDTVWFLTERGLFRIRRHTQSITLFPTNPRGEENKERWKANKVYLDRNGDLWLATVGGISKFSRRDGNWTYIRLYPGTGRSAEMLNSSSYADITSMFRDRNGVMWCGTPESGLIRYDGRNGSVRHFAFDPEHRHSLSTNHVLSIQEDPNEPDSILWIGTEGGGLNRLNTVTETFTSLTTKEGLPNNVIYAILTDGGRNFWMSTNNGLVRFNPQSGEIATYDMQDGLQSNEFNRNEFFVSTDGKFTFGGIYGYNSFYPSRIVKNTVPPAVAVTEFLLFNASVAITDPSTVLSKAVSETDSIVLEYSDNMFSFHFAALDFNAPRKNRYRYRLEGFNSDWIEADNSRSATYTNIDPGEYVFHVKASNSDGVWNAEGKRIAVTILPPFWLTWWFRAIIGLFFLAAGPIIYYIRVTQLKREQQRQQEVSQLLIVSQEAERKRIAQEMHDSLGQELLVIKNRALMGLKTVQNDSKEKRQLEQISEGATNILKSVRMMSHNLRPPELDRLGLTETIRSILSRVREVSTMTVHAELDTIDGMIKKENEINLIRILQEAVSNIDKHSVASEIHVTLKSAQQNISLIIKDNGKGFDAAAVKHGIGLAGISERVRIFHGSLSIESAMGSGTTLSIVLPIHTQNA